MSADELGAGRFPRRVCEGCGRVCIPDFAPEHVVQNPHAPDDVRTVFLCRVPAAPKPDGTLSFVGCGPAMAESGYRARVISDPFVDVPASRLAVRF